MYTFIFDDTKAMKKDMKSLQKKPEEAHDIQIFLQRFKHDPFSPEFNIKVLQPKSSKIFRIRFGNWRIIYSVDKGNKIIIIHRIGLRKDIYR